MSFSSEIKVRCSLRIVPPNGFSFDKGCYLFHKPKLCMKIPPVQDRARATPKSKAHKGFPALDCLHCCYSCSAETIKPQLLSRTYSIPTQNIFRSRFCDSFGWFSGLNSPVLVSGAAISGLAGSVFLVNYAKHAAAPELLKVKDS